MRQQERLRFEGMGAALSATHGFTCNGRVGRHLRTHVTSQVDRRRAVHPRWRACCTSALLHYRDWERPNGLCRHRQQQSVSRETRYSTAPPRAQQSTRTLGWVSWCWTQRVHGVLCQVRGLRVAETPIPRSLHVKPRNWSRTPSSTVGLRASVCSVARTHLHTRRGLRMVSRETILSLRMHHCRPSRLRTAGPFHVNQLRSQRRVRYERRPSTRRTHRKAVLVLALGRQLRQRDIGGCCDDDASVSRGTPNARKRRRRVRRAHPLRSQPLASPGTT